MNSADVRRAAAAAKSIMAALGLAASEAVVLNNSNNLMLRILPCDVVARVGRAGQESTPSGITWSRLDVAQLEVDLAQRLAETRSPVAALEPRVAPRVYERDGFVVTLWTYYEPLASGEVSSADYAHALERLHADMRRIDLTTPHFMDRVAETQQWVASRDITPELADADRELLEHTLRSLRRTIGDRSAAEQLLHGEPHPWNVLNTRSGPLFIDFENAVRGPVEYDLAWVPEAVSGRYPGVDRELLSECRGLMLAIIAASRWHRDDQHPSGRRSGAEFLSALRDGPPWPAVDDV